MKSIFPIQKLTRLAMYTAVSLMIYALESLLPPLLPVPGIKLGLANVVTLIVLCRYDFRDAALVLFCRIVLSGFFFGQALSLAYSLAGGFLCLLVMGIISRLLAKKYLPITSILGAIAHNIAQTAVAFVLTQVPYVLAYLPVLMISAIITGAFTGLTAYFVLRLLPGHLR